MLIQTKAKAVGVPVEGVQFLGDPSVHPQIFWDEDPHTKPHWRIGGEGHGGPYDSISSYLDIGVWIVGAGANLRLVPANEVERDWQEVPAVELGGAAKSVGAESIPLDVAAYALPFGGQIERCSLRDGSFRWAIRRSMGCMNKLGEWEHEPMPSNRDAEFMARCRFESAEIAYAVWVRFEGVDQK